MSTNLQFEEINSPILSDVMCLSQIMKIDEFNKDDMHGV